MAQPVTRSWAIGPRPRSLSSSSATARSWPWRTLISARCSRSLAMATASEPTSPADSGSEGLCPTATWMSPLLRGESQVGIEAFDRLDAEPQLFQGFVADHDAPVAAIGELPHAASPAVQAEQRDADRLFAE